MCPSFPSDRANRIATGIHGNQQENEGIGTRFSF
jgi:hypothetical protein